MNLGDGRSIKSEHAFVNLPAFWFREIYLQYFTQKTKYKVIRYIRAGIKLFLKNPKEFISTPFRVKKVRIPKNHPFESLIEIVNPCIHFRNAIFAGINVPYLGLEQDHKKYMRVDGKLQILGNRNTKLKEIAKNFPVHYTRLDFREKYDSQTHHQNVGFTDGVITDKSFQLSTISKDLLTPLFGYGATLLQKDESLYLRRLPINVQTLSQVIYLGFNTNFFHFIVEVCGRYLATPDSTGLKVLLPNHLPEQHFEAMELISGVPVQKYDPKTSYICEDLIVNLNYPYKNAIDTPMASLELQSVRAKVLSTLAIDTNLRDGRMYYIKRPTNSFRPMLNVDEVETLVSQYGINIITPENMTFAEQVRIFSNASLLVLESGAAMTSVMFCAPHVKIIEIQPGDGEAGYWERYCRLFELDHSLVVGKKQRFTSSSYSRDSFVLEVEKLRVELNRFLCVF